MLSRLLPLLRSLANEYAVDAALVLKDDLDYSAALRVRKEQSADSWPAALDATLRTEADRLAGHARNGNLALFLGAGVSAGAGVPTWNELLKDLAAEAGLLPPDDSQKKSDFHGLGPLDRARLVESALAARGKLLGERAAELVAKRECHSLCHGLIAGMPVDQVVTTNYDKLFESACVGAGRPVARLPHEPIESRRPRWLLKMHGCVDRPTDIVLTRTDYLRYDERRAALRGIVQAMLITRHMAFLGFSMNDDNCHRIVDDVRRALHGEDDVRRPFRRFGTCVSTEPNPLLRDLWAQDVHWVNVHSAAAGTDDVDDVDLAAYWLHEVFVDYLAAACNSTTRHLMERRYDPLLSGDERALRDLLETLKRHATAGVQQTEAWRRVEEVLHELGADGDRLT